MTHELSRISLLCHRCRSRIEFIERKFKLYGGGIAIQTEVIPCFCLAGYHTNPTEYDRLLNEISQRGFSIPESAFRKNQPTKEKDPFYE